MPDSAITVHDPYATSVPDPNSVRWNSATPLELSRANVSQNATDRPYVQIDLNDPNGEFYLSVCNSFMN